MRVNVTYRARDHGNIISGLDDDPMGNDSDDFASLPVPTHASFSKASSSKSPQTKSHTPLPAIGTSRPSPYENYETEHGSGRQGPSPTIMCVQQDPHLNHLHDRLLENERGLRTLMLQTGSLQGEINESLRFHDGALRDEAQMRCTLESQLHAMNDMMRNMHDQTAAIAQHLKMERETTFYGLELQRTRDLEYKALEERMHRKFDENHTQIAQLLRNDVGARLDKHEKDLRQITDIVAKIVKDDQAASLRLASLQEQVRNLDSKFSGAIKNLEANLASATKMLQEVTLNTQKREEAERSKLWRDLSGQIEDGKRRIQDEEDARRKQMQSKYEELKRRIDEERTKLAQFEKVSLSELASRVRELESKFESKLIEQDGEHKKVTQEIVGTIGAIRSSLDVLREEFHKESDSNKEYLMKEMRKMTRPLLVM